MQPTQSERRSKQARNRDNRGGARGERSALSLKDVLLRMAVLGLIDAIALWLAFNLWTNGMGVVALILALVTILVNWVLLDDRLFPIRWLTPGLLLMLLMVIYPLLFTLYIALTNYSDGHILSKEQVIGQFTSQYYRPENARTYTWTAYRSPAGEFKIVFQNPEGNYFLGDPDEGLQPYQPPGGQLPPEIDGHQRLERAQTLQYLQTLTQMEVRGDEHLIRVTGLGQAAESLPQFSYDPATDTLTNNETGTTYRPVRGTFTADDGSTLQPGFWTVVGFENYARVLTDRNIRGPFLGVFIWTIIFAFLSVALTFAVGLGMALVVNDSKLPLRTMFRSVLIIPYTIPAVISVLIWTGLLNPIYGQFSIMLRETIGFVPDWFSDGTWAKVGILLVQTWLGFPYMMLLCLGALQSIPSDMFEAADIDGAGPLTKFSRLTLPLLLVSIAPLLIGSFAFNFNNFAVIELYNRGGPPIAGASTPAGQTDILISYTYRLAFAGGQGADFGMASAIALFIFLIVAGLTAFNFRYTRQLEDLT